MGRRRIIRHSNGLDEEPFIDYAERKTTSVNEAYVNLVLAVRQQAICDGKLKEWEYYWLGDPDFSALLKMFLRDYHDQCRNRSSASQKNTTHMECE